MVVFDDFALLVTVVGRDSAVATEGNPLRESVERFAFVGCCLDENSQLGVANVFG